MFNVNLLIPTATDPLPRQLQLPSLPIEVNRLEEFSVEEIIDVITDRRSCGGKLRLRYVIK